MTTPAVSLLLCTVRPPAAYRDHPEWVCIEKVIDDLSVQVDAPEFELVVVDGVSRRFPAGWLTRPRPFDLRHVPPRAGSPWVRMRKVAISAYRNTGIAAARGELILNLDDTAVLPPNYVGTIWRAWRDQRIAIGPLWPHRGDSRIAGRVTTPGQVYGFGSYPRELALELNGYDEAYDGGQALEDCDWSTRLFHAGLDQGLIHMPGFDHAPQGEWSPEAVDIKRRIVKCCNAAWQAQRVRRQVRRANIPELWNRETLGWLVGPCPHLHGTQCGHHGDRQRCAYLDEGFPTALDPEAAVVFDEPPVLNLERLSEEMR